MLTVVLDCTTTSKIASYLDTSTAIAFGSDARGVIDHADQRIQLDLGPSFLCQINAYVRFDGKIY
jgi:hypothetical protein